MVYSNIDLPLADNSLDMRMSMFCYTFRVYFAFGEHQVIPLLFFPATSTKHFTILQSLDDV